MFLKTKLPRIQSEKAIFRKQIDSIALRFGEECVYVVMYVVRGSMQLIESVCMFCNHITGNVITRHRSAGLDRRGWTGLGSDFVFVCY